jgi:hypothetical protein
MVLWVDEIIKDEAAHYFAKSAKGKVSSSYPLPNVGMPMHITLKCIRV